MEPGLYRQINQDRRNVSQYVHDHRVGQERRSEFYQETREKGEGQVHEQTPKDEASIQDQREEHMLGREEYRRNEPGSPAVLELSCESRHAIREIGRQFSKSNSQWEKKTQHERPCRQGGNGQGDEGTTVSSCRSSQRDQSGPIYEPVPVVSWRNRRR